MSFEAASGVPAHHGASGNRLLISAILGPAALAFLSAPFIMLAFATDWGTFHFAPGDGGRSGSPSVTLCSRCRLWSASARRWHGGWRAATSMASGQWMRCCFCRCSLRRWQWAFCSPRSMGHTVLSVPLGRLGLVLTNSTAAFMVAQVYGAMPYYVFSARAAFEGVPVDLEQIALTLGKEPWQVFLEVTLPLARLGLVAGLALAWIRALGEFGIVLIIAYYPQGIPVKLWVNLQDIGLPAVYPLLWLFFLVAMPLPLWLGLLSRRRGIF